MCQAAGGPSESAGAHAHDGLLRVSGGANGKNSQEVSLPGVVLPVRPRWMRGRHPAGEARAGGAGPGGGRSLDRGRWMELIKHITLPHAPCLPRVAAKGAGSRLTLQGEVQPQSPALFQGAEAPRFSRPDFWRLCPRAHRALWAEGRRRRRLPPPQIGCRARGQSPTQPLAAIPT